MTGRQAEKIYRLRPEQFVMFLAGGLLIASGLFHLSLWLADGSSLSGPVSWRKPILFGFSAGVTVVSVGWLAGKLKRRFGDFFLLTAFSAAMLVEVGLITLQQWRGVASHFNRATPFDATVLAWIECLIVFATIVILDMTQRCFRPLPTSRDMTLAIRGGMGLLLFSCLLGFVLVAYGDYRVATGRPPEVFGAAGVMKFPHGMPMHAIQFLPVMSWLLRTLGAREPQRLRAIAFAVGSMVGFTAFSLLQTFSGRARLDVSWVSGLVLVGSVALMLVPAGMLLFQTGRGFYRYRVTVHDRLSS